MALDDTDRRRFFLALIVTLLALPALWWFNRDNDNDPAQVTVATESAPTTTEAPPTTIGQTNLPAPEEIDDEPIFLDGPEGQIGGVPEIAVPGQPTTETIIADATYQRSLAGQRTCLSRTILTGGTITVVNLDNNRSTTCQVSLAPPTQREDLVMDVEQFTEIADLTDAPIPVEIRL